MATRKPASKEKAKGKATIRIKQIGSGIQAQRSHKETLRSLGFKRLNQIVELPDNPAVRGMIRRVTHLVEIV